MTDYTKLNTATAQTAVDYDAGLRAFMLKVYNYMTMALVMSGAIAYFAGTSVEFQNTIMANHALVYIIMFAPLVLVFIFSMRLQSMSLQATQALYWVFSAVMGLSLWFVFAIYTRESIVETFFITAATFGGMSLFGYTTKRDLTGMGHFMIMGLWGIIIASIINIFMHNSMASLLISVLGVVIFTGLTAYDTQKLKQYYYMGGSDATASGKLAISGALNLYLDFLNLFLMLLRLMGNRR